MGTWNGSCVHWWYTYLWLDSGQFFCHQLILHYIRILYLYAYLSLYHISVCTTSQSVPHLSLYHISVCTTSQSVPYLSLYHISVCTTSQSVPYLSLYHISVCTTSQSVPHLSLYHISVCTTSQSVPYLSLYHISVCTISQSVPYLSLYHILVTLNVCMISWVVSLSLGFLVIKVFYLSMPGCWFIFLKGCVVIIAVFYLW